jgi:FdhD protein
VAGEWASELEPVANESLVSIHVNQEKITSLLASDSHLEALFRGHLAAEYDCIIQGQIIDYRVVRTKGTIELHGAVPSFKPKIVRDGLVTTSCSACDHQQLSSLLSDIPRVDEPQTKMVMESILDALSDMRKHQHGFHATGGMHAAAISYLHGLVPTIDVVCEDIGRHNAVDKVMGEVLAMDEPPRPNILFLSGRCGWDIVAKAARMNIPFIASIGAASDLAIQTARMANMTLISFVRNEKAVVFGRQEGRFQPKD